MNKSKCLKIFNLFILLLTGIALSSSSCSTIIIKSEPINICAAGPMAYNSGRSIYNGCMMAAEEINAAGGINVNGKKHFINIVKIDTNEMMSVSDAGAAIEKAVTLEKANCLIGGTKLEAVLEEQDRAADLSTIFICTANSDPEPAAMVKKDYERYKYWFRTNLNSVYSAYFFYLHTVFVADILKKDLGLQNLKAALIVEKGTRGEAFVSFWETSLSEIEIKIVKTFRPNSNSQNMSSEINELRESGAQIVLQFLTGDAGITFAREWNVAKLPCLPLGLNIPAQSKGISDAASSMMNYLASGTFIANAAITAKTVPFFNKFKDKYKDYPGYGGPSYDAVLLFKEAVEKADSLDSGKIASAMETLDFTGVSNRIIFGGMNTPFPHDILSRQNGGFGVMPLVQWINGEQVCVWPSGINGTQQYRIPPWMIPSK